MFRCYMWRQQEFQAPGEGLVLIRKVPATIVSDQTTYSIHICGQGRPDGTWEGWIEFHAVGMNTMFRTDQETSQPNLSALEYWADGLEPVYFEGAFTRAQERLA